MEIGEPVKRRVERIQFFQPLPARFGVASVVLSDLTPTGAGIQHQARIDRGDDHPLRFRWQDHDVSISSRVVRTRLECYRLGGASLTLYRSGLHFVDPAEDQRVILRKIITGKVARALEEQRANAYALTLDEVQKAPPGTFAEPKPAFNLNDFFEGAVNERGFYRCAFAAGRWTRTWTVLPEQPDSGFTVSAAEGDDAMGLLCRTYEQADLHGRELIRTMAQLSVTQPSEVRRDRFKP